jgi:hypothetical protein
MPWKMLAAGQYAGPVETTNERKPAFCDLFRRITKAAIADDGVQWIAVNIEHGSEVAVEAKSKQATAYHLGSPFNQVDVTDTSQTAHAWQGECWFRQSRHSATFLIDREQGWQSRIGSRNYATAVLPRLL